MDTGMQDRLYSELVAFFEKKGVLGLTQADFEGLWKRCIWLYRDAVWRGGAEDLFWDTVCKVAEIEPGEWPPVGERKAWLKRIATNLFLDQIKTANRRDTREREYAERQQRIKAVSTYV